MKRLNYVRIMIVFAFCLTPIVAVGQTDAGWNHLAWEAASALVGIVGTVAIAVLTALVAKYLGVKIDAHQQEQLRKYADQAIDYAEQRANNTSIDKSDRSQVALGYLLEMVGKSKIPNIASEAAAKLIESRLGLINSTAPAPLADIKAAVDVK